MTTRSSTREFLMGQLTKAQASGRAPLGDVTRTVAVKQNVPDKPKSLVDKKPSKPADKILVSALKHSESEPKRKQVQFRPAVTRAAVPKFCVCDPVKSRPLVACEQCSDWHLPACCGISGDSEDISNVKAVCLSCKQLQIVTKLFEKIKKATPPSHAQAQAVCTKLKIPLPLNPTHDDALIHLAVFLLKAPELRAALCSGETNMEEVARKLEICGVKRGEQGQMELLGDLSFSTLRQACRMGGLEANSSKHDAVVKLHAFLTGTWAPPLPVEPMPRKRAKTKPQQSPGAPKPNSRLAAKHRRMLRVFKIAELKKECKSRGLSTTGTQEEVVARLVEYLASQDDGKPHPSECTCDICDLENAMSLAEIDLPSELSLK